MTPPPSTNSLIVTKWLSKLRVSTQQPICLTHAASHSEHHTVTPRLSATRHPHVQLHTWWCVFVRGSLCVSACAATEPAAWRWFQVLLIHDPYVDELQQASQRISISQPAVCVCDFSSALSLSRARSRALALSLSRVCSLSLSLGAADSRRCTRHWRPVG